MAVVIHRSTLQVVYSVSLPRYPEPTWLRLTSNPDGSSPEIDALGGEPSKYWLLTGDTLSVMDQAGKDAVDAAEAAAELATSRAQASATPETPGLAGTEALAEIEARNKRDNYLANRSIQLQDALLAMKASSGNNAQALRDAIPASFLATATRPRSDAVQDYQDDINNGQVDP